jgi:hypothetical protein
MDGTISSHTTPRYMPLLHEFTSKGASTVQMRTIFSRHHAVNGWIPHFYGITALEYGCSDEGGCNTLTPSILDPKSIMDIFDDDLGYRIYLFSEKPSLIRGILGHTWPIVEFDASTDPTFFEDFHFSGDEESDRLILVHWNVIDRLGYTDGFGSENYNLMISCVDQQIHKITMQLWDYSPNGTTFLFMTDRGGKGFNHDLISMDALQVAFAMWGKNVKSHLNLMGHVVESQQIAPTLLDVVAHGNTDVVPSYWTVVPITQVYDDTHYAIMSQIPSPTTYPPVECRIPHYINHKYIISTIQLNVVLSLITAIAIITII